MAWIKCKYCNKRISDKKLVCPRCNKNLQRENVAIKTIILKSLYVFAQVVLCFTLCCLSSRLFYSDSIFDLFVVFGICLVIYINVCLACYWFLKKRKMDIFVITAGVVTVVSFVFSTVYLVKGINAFRYDNNNEVLRISKSFDVKMSKKIKNSLESYFEYDFDNVFSRDVIINNFYCTDDVCNLYLDDIYNNYSLKFFVTMKKNKIIDIYWTMDKDKFYLVEDGKKTENFEYYYAMNIVSSVSGEDVSGLATIEGVVEQKVTEKLDDVSAVLLTYEKLNYLPEENAFYRDCEVESMDFSGNMNNSEFSISFEKNDSKNKSSSWYYGDSSFDYVNWNVNI